MNANEWAERYRIGVLEIDEQHAMLFQLLDDFEQASNAGVTHDQQAEVLERLVSYVKFHFRAEEKLMSDRGFPELRRHVSQHREFEGKVIEFVTQFEQDRANISAPVVEFLKTWIFEHILVEDTKISQFLAK